MQRDEVPEDVALEELEEESLQKDEIAGEYLPEADLNFEVPEADALEQRTPVPRTDDDYR